MKIAVFGAGLMGRAALYDLANADNVVKTGIYDIDNNLAEDIKRKYGNENTLSGIIDAGDENAAYEILKNYDSVVSCVTYKYNPILTKAAIKAGQKLSNTEIRQLLLEKEQTQQTSRCPHGRPTTINFSITELYKQFKRT